MTGIIASGKDSLVELGVDAIKGVAKGSIDENKLRESLSSYIESQIKYSEVYTTSEEFDFAGLIEYIHDNLLDEVRKRISYISPKERRAARESVVAAAVAAAHATTLESRKTVARYVYSCLDIINAFYKKKIDIQHYVLASEAVDAVNDKINDVAADIKTEIKAEIHQVAADTKKELSEEIKQAGSLYSLDSLAAQAQSGNLSCVNDRIRMIFNSVSITHPLYPYYGYGWKNNNLVSLPLIPEATEKYPVRYRFNGPIKIGNQYVTDLSSDVLDYAYRHQLKLVMEVTEAKKYLGDIIDPVQYDVQKIVGGELYAAPPEFPPAFACSIIVGNQVYFEDVLMRTQEILDDGTYVFSNKEQPDVHFQFEVRTIIGEILLNNEGKAIEARDDNYFRTSLRNASNSEALKYLQFLKAMETERKFTILVLDNKKPLVVGRIDNTYCSKDSKDIDKEIDFLERICEIEKYFHILLHMANKISTKDYETISLISDLIRKGKVEETWTNVTFTGSLDEQFRNNLMKMDAKMGAVSYVGTYNVEIFGAKLEFKVKRTFYDAIMEDHERVIKLAELSRVGDPIKISFRAGENNKVDNTLLPNII